MAIDVNNARFLLSLKRNGIPFSKIATVGRQGLFILPELIQQIFKEAGVKPAVNDEHFFGSGSASFSENFFKELGVEELVTIDYSDYEGATVIQDMNKPLDPSLHSKFSTLIDSGSLEHMFNFPQAIKNYMDLVKPGGFLILVNMPINNHMGHGFYQFSPELFYNLLNEENGFEILKLLVAEDFPFTDFYEVTNPKDVNERIGLCNSEPVQLFLVARKKESKSQLNYPIQNDYAKSWASNTKQSSEQRPQIGIKEKIRSFLRSQNAKKYFQFSVRRNWKLKAGRYRLDNERFYSKVEINSIKV